MINFNGECPDPSWSFWLHSPCLHIVGSGAVIVYILQPSIYCNQNAICPLATLSRTIRWLHGHDRIAHTDH